MKTAGCDVRPGGGDVVKRILSARFLPRTARPRQHECRARFLANGTDMTLDPPFPRLTLRPDLATAEGEPRICITWPGSAAPVAFSTITAALAALRDMEERHGRR